MDQNQCRGVFMFRVFKLFLECWLKDKDVRGRRVKIFSVRRRANF
jgi:hypothetical protein